VPPKVKVYLDGVIAGIIGALIVAIMFLFLDAITRLPLYTPTLLGEGLFVGGHDLAATDSAQVSLQLAVMYTWVHFLVFIVLGVIAAQFLLLIKNDFALGSSILLLFVILEIGFIATWFVLDRGVLDKLSWTMVVVGNSLAAIGMATYLSLRIQNLSQTESQ